MDIKIELTKNSHWNKILFPEESYISSYYEKDLSTQMPGLGHKISNCKFDQRDGSHKYTSRVKIENIVFYYTLGLIVLEVEIDQILEIEHYQKRNPISVNELQDDHMKQVLGIGFTQKEFTAYIKELFNKPGRV